MASYASTQQLKATGRMDVDRNDLDSVFDTLLEVASRRIDRYYAATGAPENCWFQTDDATRYYGFERVRGQTLHLDAPLISVTTLTNADGITLSSGAYRLHPRNGIYYTQIRLLSSYAWQYAVDGEIEVTGAWGFAASPPPEVAEACMMLASHYYRHYAESLSEIELPENINVAQFISVMDSPMPKTVRDILPIAGPGL